MSSVINIYKGTSSLSKLGFVADSTTYNLLCTCTTNLCNQVDTLAGLVADIQDCNTNLNTCLVDLSTNYTTCTECLQTQVTTNTNDITDLKENKADCSYTHVLGNCVECLQTQVTTNTNDITDLKENKADCSYTHVLGNCVECLQTQVTNNLNSTTTDISNINNCTSTLNTCISCLKTCSGLNCTGTLTSHCVCSVNGCTGNVTISCVACAGCLCSTSTDNILIQSTSSTSTVSWGIACACPVVLKISGNCSTDAVFFQNYPSTGQLSLKIDGQIYVCEGRCCVPFVTYWNSSTCVLCLCGK